MAAGRPGEDCQPAVSCPILGPSITRYEAGACPLAGTGSRRAGHSPLFRGRHWQAALPALCLPPGQSIPAGAPRLHLSAPRLQEPRKPRHPCSCAGEHCGLGHVPLPGSPMAILCQAAKHWHLRALEPGSVTHPRAPCPPQRIGVAAFNLR